MKNAKKVLSVLLSALLLLGTVALGGTVATAEESYSVGDTLEYGTYPQSEVKDADTIAALSAKLSDDGWVSYGYYSGTGTSDDGNMAPSDYMKYQDVVLDGVKYRAVKFDSYRPYCTGYTSSSNQQSSNGYSTDTTYWFRFEPIEWKVLDPDSGLVVCASAIDSQAYNNYILSADGEYWGNAEKNYRANDYANSSIRAWLNNDFINTAFSSSQQENIKVTELDNSCPYDSNYDSETTSDKIFLLSYNEVTNSAYGFNSNASAEDTARVIASSDYAKCQGIYMNSAGNSNWLLRSPGSYSHVAFHVDYFGFAERYYGVYLTSGGVVPALKLQNLESDPTGVPVIVKPEMTVTVTPENPVSDGSFTLTVNLPDDAAGNVIIRFNEVDLLGYIQLANGNSQDFNCLQSGTYSGTARYMPAENSNYEEVTVEFSFRVSAAAPNMTLTAEDITYGETATVTANLPNDTMWGSVTFFLDNADTGKEVYVSQGKAVCTFGGLNAGEHTVEAVFANDDKYADETKNVTFNVAQKALTITAVDQSYPFNDQIQGEGGTAYEDPAEIAEKVTVEGLVAGDTLESIILDGQAKDIGEHEGIIAPSSAVIKNSGGQDVTANYNITYTAGKLTISSVNAPLTINYVYENGTTAADSYTDNIEIFTGYSVTSPEITGYTPDKETVEGTMENIDGVTETVTYTAIEYTATFVDENGNTVDEVKFTVETEKLDEPAVPEKTNYNGEWEEYIIEAKDLTIKPVYTLAGETKVTADCGNEITLDYKELKTYNFNVEYMPEGATAHVFYNGEDRGEGTSIEVKEPTGDYTVECKVLDADGNEIATSGEIKVKVKNSFFDRLKWFFNNFWANILKTFIEALIKAC